MTTTTRYLPQARPGTSAADHLECEITELLPAQGYATREAARRGWWRAARRANAHRRTLGYAPVSRPDCRVVEVVR